MRDLARDIGIACIGVFAGAVVLALAVLAASGAWNAARADTGPVLMVHYWTDLENARKRAIGAGFQGIRDLEYVALPAGYATRGGYNRGDCNRLRTWVRAEDRAGRGTSYYSGDRDWSDTPCSVYRFRAERYIGPPSDLGRDAP